jgi:hypothetical protein
MSNDESTKLEDCVNKDCERNDNDNLCCYDLFSKIREFLHSDMYMLEYKDIDKNSENVDRFKILYNKFFQPYNIKPGIKIGVETNGKYYDIFGIIPLELVPASYIPFNYKNYEMNLDRLSNGDIFSEDDYKQIFFDYNKNPDPKNKDYISQDDLKNYLEYCLKKKLNNPKSIFNAYNTNTITILVCILWFFIIVQAFNILFYYYRDIYSYILLFITILVILIAIIWKMIYILNVS